MWDTSTIVAIASVCGSVLGILSFWMNFSNRITEANSKAEAAGKQASSATARVISLETTLNNLRVEVARDYVDNGKLDAMEKRIVDAIKGLGERVDHAFANKGGH